MALFATHLAEDGEVEVVVVVGDGDLARRVDAHADWVVGDSCKEWTHMSTKKWWKKTNVIISVK